MYKKKVPPLKTVSNCLNENLKVYKKWIQRFTKLTRHICENSETLGPKILRFFRLKEVFVVYSLNVDVNYFKK